MIDFDENKIAEEVIEDQSIEYRDPYKKPWGDPKKQTETQKKAWTKLQNGIWRIGAIGGKGAGKSYLGATFIMHFAQKHPNTQGAIAANSKRQTKDSIGSALVNVAHNCGYEIEYYRTKKINGQERSLLYTIDMDGKGLETGKTHKVLVRPLESIERLEGTELDYLLLDEVQDAAQGDVQKAITRNRGTGIANPGRRNPLYISGMTRSELHWMYTLMEEKLGFRTEDKFDPDEDNAILFEPTLFENKENLGEEQIEEYREMMDGRTAEQEIYAIRTSGNDNRVLHQYRDDLHRTGRMSDLCAYYDPGREVIVSVDFNVSPMSATLWQEKPWSDDWLDEDLAIHYDSDGYIESVELIEHTEEGSAVIETFDSLEEYSSPDEKILAQVDEFEVWPDDKHGGGTDGLMRNLLEEYRDHPAEMVITGDARGDTRDTRSRTSDWGIIREYARKLGAGVVPGTVSNMSGGNIKYDNPPKEDAIKLTNRVLQNSKGEIRICFLPQSQYESGGAAASVAALSRKPDGRIDDRMDRKEGKEVRRSHFADTVLYVVWFWQDGSSPTAEEFDKMVSEVEETGGGPGVDFLEEDPGTQWF